MAIPIESSQINSTGVSDEIELIDAETLGATDETAGQYRSDLDNTHIEVRIKRDDDGDIDPTLYTSAGVRDNEVTKAWQVAAAGPTFVDMTDEINDGTANNVIPFPATEAEGDYFAIGFTKRHRNFKHVIGTSGVGGAVTWEYTTAVDTWSALPGVTDGGSGFTASPGTVNLTFDPPANWASVALNGVTAFWIRARITTVYSTNPLLTQGWLRTGYVLPGIRGSVLNLDDDMDFLTLPGTFDAQVSWPNDKIKEGSRKMRAKFQMKSGAAKPFIPVTFEKSLIVNTIEETHTKAAEASSRTVDLPDAINRMILSVVNGTAADDTGFVKKHSTTRLVLDDDVPTGVIQDGAFVVFADGQWAVGHGYDATENQESIDEEEWFLEESIELRPALATAPSAGLGYKIYPSAVSAEIDRVLNILQGLVLKQGTIGATGNDATHLHLAGLTYGDGELNGYAIVVFDASTGEYHATEIRDWVLLTELATVTELPFTPEPSVDTYWLLFAGTVEKFTGAVWDKAIADHLGAGSTGEALNAAGAGGDPWTTQLPGAYGAGSAGKIVGDSSADVTAIKAKTDNLPASPAAVSDIPTVAQVQTAAEAAIAAQEPIDANLIQVIGMAVDGTGIKDDPWGPS